MRNKADKNGKSEILIRREEVVEGEHHGGSWKVAYADFVTAMMAFFLLMWLLNATTEEQRRGLADYFSPTVCSAMRRQAAASRSVAGPLSPKGRWYPTLAPRRSWLASSLSWIRWTRTNRMSPRSRGHIAMTGRAISRTRVAIRRRCQGTPVQ
jgi:hypothetical protein